MLFDSIIFVGNIFGVLYKAHNFLSNLLPHIDELDGSSEEVQDLSSEKITSVATNVGETLNKMFMKLNDDIVDAKCDLANIISPKGTD